MKPVTNQTISRDMRNVAALLKAADLRAAEMTERIEHLESIVHHYGAQISEMRYDLTDCRSTAQRIRYKAGREIREHVKKRLALLGLPPENYRSTLFAAIRREFGGVNSYHDLLESQVRDVHRFIDAWQPEKLAEVIDFPRYKETKKARRTKR